MDSSSDKVSPQPAIAKITQAVGTSDGTATVLPPRIAKTSSAPFTTNNGQMPSRRIILTYRESELIAAFMVRIIGELDKGIYDNRDLACCFTRNEMMQALTKIQPPSEPPK